MREDVVGDLHGFTSADLCRKFVEYPKMVTHTTAMQIDAARCRGGGVMLHCAIIQCRQNNLLSQL